MPHARGALDGVVVLDLSKVLAGPYCTMILGDLGADVIKIERPEGDESRTWGPPFINGQSAHYLAVNRNKRSAVADLRTGDGRALVTRIARRADVLVENFLPGALERLGLSLAELRAANPRLITLAISGMGASGPDMNMPGYDFIMQAAGGLMSLTGPPAGPAHKAGLPIVDLTTGMMAANAVLAALFARERTGCGQHLDISLLETHVAWLANVGTGYLMTGREPPRHGNTHPTIVPYQLFRGCDGEVAVGVGNDAQFQRFCGAMELPDLAGDARYQTNAGRVQHRDVLVAAIADVLGTFSVAEIVAKLRPANVPVSAVRSVAQVLNDPQVIARGMVETVTHPAIGEVRLLGIPFKFSDTPATVRRAPPLLGEHTAEIYAEYAAAD
ncbi:MAG TPA: CoA transferase [Longimicrobiales bacterium]